jgi:DivIVA domain-containing protein
MTHSEHEFRVVLRGYEPAEVDRVIATLEARAVDAETAVTALERRVAEAASASATPAEPPSYEHLGERIG